ncbi:MAG: hypothetical protein U0V56_07455 [Actinomycetota bacterium]
MLLGVRFVLAESFERIHRSNLVGWASSRSSLSPATRLVARLDGREAFAVRGLDQGVTAGMRVTVEATDDAGSVTTFPATVSTMAPPSSSTSRTAASCAWSCARCSRVERAAIQGPRARSPGPGEGPRSLM